jgi:SAM-dependent methyltransferase
MLVDGKAREHRADLMIGADGYRSTVRNSLGLTWVEQCLPTTSAANHSKSWLHLRRAPIFERLADRYDDWYEGPVGRTTFLIEVECLAPLLAGAGHPRLEIGAGGGRFARALGVEVGVDPAHAALRLAHERGVASVRGVGEALPFRDGAFASVPVVVTLCFADDAPGLLHEAGRVLDDGGSLVLGMVFAGNRGKALAGHPFYSVARFLAGELPADPARPASAPCAGRC